MHYSLMDFTRNFNALFIDGLHKTSQETLMHYSLMDFTQETLMHYSLMDFTRNFNALFIDGLHKKL